MAVRTYSARAVINTAPLPEFEWHLESLNSLSEELDRSNNWYNNGVCALELQAYEDLDKREYEFAQQYALARQDVADATGKQYNARYIIRKQ